MKKSQSYSLQSKYIYCLFWRPRKTGQDCNEILYQAGKASAETAPVEDVGVDVQGEAGKPDVANETLLFHLLQCWNRLFDDLQQSYRCSFNLHSQ